MTNINFYNTVLPEGVYEGTASGNQVKFTVDAVICGFIMEDYIKGIDCPITVTVIHEK